MSAMKWFRKHNKKLLAVFGVLLMVMFLLPSLPGLTGRGRESQRDQVIGYLTDDKGEKIEILASMRNLMNQRLQILREIGINVLCRLDYSNPPILSQLGGRQGAILESLGPAPVADTSLLFFSDLSYALAARQRLRQQALGWAAEKAEYEHYLEYINQLTDIEMNSSWLYFMLLVEEAHRMGVYATDSQVQQVFETRKIIIQQGVRLQPISSVLQNYRVTENDLRRAVGDYLSILRYGHMVTSYCTVSEPQLRRRIRDIIEKNKINGDYVQINAGAFLDRAGEPSEKELDKQLAAYKQYEKEDTTDENPFGFGYLLPDRLQVEYLKVDIIKAEAVASGKFDKLPVAKQEQKLQDYWSNHRELFRLHMAPDPCDPQTPRFRDPPFDEVYLRVKKAYMRKQGQETAQLILGRAQQDIEKQTNAAVDSSGQSAPTENAPAPPEETSSEQTETIKVDYAALAEKLSSKELKVTHGTTEYFSIASPPAGLNFDMSYKMRHDKPQRNLMEILFDCKPLHKGAVSKLDVPPVKLQEDISSILAFDYATRPIAAYIVRIVGVDKQREPVTLDDNGKEGAYSAEKTQKNKASKESDPCAAGKKEMNPEDEDLREKVKNDCRLLQAYNMALKEAQKLAQQGSGDWDAALKGIKDSLKVEPNQPVPMSFLQENTLANKRQQNERIFQMLQDNPRLRNNPQMYSSYIRAVTENNILLNKATHLAQELYDTDPCDVKKDSSKPLPLLELPGQRCCLVFKDMDLVRANEDEYLQRKPLVTREIEMDNQALLSLVHFNPVNIEKRMGYIARTSQQEETQEP